LETPSSLIEQVQVRLFNFGTVHLINGKIPFQAHINAAETKRLAELGQKYRNPYNFGPAHNWHLFLGNLPQISNSTTNIQL
jgi:hypothetical protein